MQPNSFPSGIPRSFRMMQGFGVNTYTLINAEGERHFVKFHMIPELGVHSLVWDEALKICGQDPGMSSKTHNALLFITEQFQFRFPS
jgi:catalase